MLASRRKPVLTIFRWRNMIARCRNQANKAYAGYGGRGVYVCQRWESSFGNFKQDLGDPPSPLHTLDRIDNGGSYTCGKCRQCIDRGAPLNVRWATPEVQMNNTRYNRRITYRGLTLTMAQWSRQTGIHQATIRQRFMQGRPLDEVFSRKSFAPGQRSIVRRKAEER